MEKFHFEPDSAMHSTIPSPPLPCTKKLITRTPLIRTIPYITTNTTGVFDLNPSTRWPKILDSQSPGTGFERAAAASQVKRVNLPSAEFMTQNPRHLSLCSAEN